MEWEMVREQLEKDWGVPLSVVHWGLEEWQEAQKDQPENEGPRGTEAGHVISNGQVLWYVQREGTQAVLLAADEKAVTPGERRLVQIVLNQRRGQERRPAIFHNDEEGRAAQIRDWFRQQQELGLQQAEMPDALVSQLSLYSTKIPLLLYGDYSTSRRVQYSELKKLLESFFEAEILLIPLTEKEWLILASEKILLADAAEDRNEGEEETKEEQLAALGYGLHAMLENEWVGESHLAIHYPILPAKSLYAAILQLRETIMLGRTYHVGSNMHLPWALQLEKLLHLIPESEKNTFLERVLKRLDVVFDPETMTTLDYFFQLDCNVSETAKKLYIHRNTLLYRLDKFKQETGLDVRTFNNAVLVKIAMLLYKVTKRK